MITGIRTPAPQSEEKIYKGQLLAVVVIAVVTGFAMVNIGFVFATVPGFFLFGWAFGYRRIAILAAVSLVAPLAIWALFTFGFELPLPRSPWFHRI